MSCILKMGLVNIELMLINTANSRYSVSGLHQFSECCKSPVGNKKYCKGCGKAVLSTDILKGLDKETILTQEQQENLKGLLENNSIEVLGIKDITPTSFFEIVPYVQKTQIVYPNISKGYKPTSIKTFYSFMGSLKKMNKYLICKFVGRGLEHLTLLMPYGDNFMLFYLPFKAYNNFDEVKRIGEGVKNTIEADNIKNLDSFKKEATDFIKKFKNKETKLDLIKEEKLVLLKNMVEDIRNGVVDTTPTIIKEVNPFC